MKQAIATLTTWCTPASLAMTISVLFGLFVIGMEVAPVVGDQLPSGWDRLPHLYLCERMLGYLREGTISGYNPFWFAGYPEFRLYPPLFYMVTAGLALLLTTSLTAVCNTITAFIPFLIILSFVLAAAHQQPRQALFAGFVLALGYLSVGFSYAPVGLGLGGLLLTGLVPNYAAVPLFLLFIREFQRPRPRVSVLTLILGTTITLHSLTALFLLWILAVYLVWSRTGAACRDAFLATAGGALLSAWWWVPALPYLPYASGQPIGLTGDLPDPLFALLPGINALSWQALSSTLAIAWHSHRLSDLLEVALRIPWLSLILVVFFSRGLLLLFREGKSFLPTLFLSSLIVLPRDYLGQIFDLGIHFYRFTQHIAAIGYLIAAAGLTQFFVSVGRRSTVVQCWIWTFTVLLVAVLPFDALDRTQLFAWQRDMSQPAPLPLMRLEQYEDFDAGMFIAGKVAEEPLVQRVATEASMRFMGDLGSPHFFSTILPFKFKIPVVSGLLAESAYSSRYIHPTVSIGSEHLVWGKYVFPFRSLHRLPSASVLERYRLFGVSHLVSGSAQFTKYLAENLKSDLTLIGRKGRYSAFRIREPLPLVGKPAHVPPLFIELRPGSFDRFAAAWYLEDDALNRPVVRVADPSVNPEILEQTEGFIVGAGSDPMAVRAWLERALADDRPYLFLHATPPVGTALPQRIRFLPRLSRAEDTPELARLISDLFRPNSILPTSASLQGTDLHLTERGPMIIRYSYSPGITGTGKIMPYLLTPSLVFIFSEGGTVITFR